MFSSQAYQNLFKFSREEWCNVIHCFKAENHAQKGAA